MWKGDEKAGKGKKEYERAYVITVAAAGHLARECYSKGGARQNG